MKSFEKLVGIMHQLRRECPWDKEQSLKSLRRYVIEEAYEVVDAIDQSPLKGYKDLIEELGDLQLQVVFQAEILQEALPEENVLEKIIDGINEKMIRRHPHVFAEVKADSAEQVLANWEEIKDQEKPNSKNSFSDVSASFPSLTKALKLGKRAKKLQFDWDSPQEVWEKFESEVRELTNARSRDEEEDELGDVLFCLAQWARHKNIDPEIALNRANEKFLRRYYKMEDLAEKDGKDLEKLSMDQKEELWTRAKKEEASTPKAKA